MAVKDTDTSSEAETESIPLEDMEVTVEELKEIEEPSEEVETDDESETQIDEPATDTEESEEETEVETEEPTEAEKQKAHNKEMAEKRIAAKRERDELIRRQQLEYIEGTEDPLESATRQNQVELYTIKVENLTNKLTNSYEKAINDFKILSDQTPEVREMVDEAIDTFQALYVPVDAYGNPKEIKADFYQYLSNKATSIEKLTGIKSQKQTEAKTKEKSKVFTPPAKTPKPTKSDPEMDAFLEEAYGK